MNTQDKHLYVETSKEHGVYKETVEIGNINALYLLVDIDVDDHPYGVEVLDADQKLAKGYLEYVVRDDGTVVFSNDEAIYRHDVIYQSIMGYINYDQKKRIVELRFWRIPNEHLKYGQDNYEDSCFEAFLKECNA